MTSPSWNFAVVEFSDGTVLSTDVIPRCWVASSENECFWPSKKLTSNGLDKLVINMQDPDYDWESYPIKILSKTASYQEAVRKRNNAMKHTDCESQSSDCGAPMRKKRRIVKPSRFSSEIVSDLSDPQELLTALPPPTKRPAKAQRDSSCRKALVGLQSFNDDRPRQTSTPRISRSVNSDPPSEDSSQELVTAVPPPKKRPTQARSDRPGSYTSSPVGTQSFDDSRTQQASTSCSRLSRSVSIHPPPTEETQDFGKCSNLTCLKLTGLV